MRLDITLTEVHYYLRNHFQLDIGLRNIEINKVKVTKIESVVLSIKEVKGEVMLFQYEVDWIAGLMVHVAHYFLRKKLSGIPVEWDSTRKEIKIDLNKIPELSVLLKVVQVTELRFEDDAIVLIFNAKDKV